MKIIKLLLSISLVAVIAVLLVAALAPSEYALEKEIVINKNRSEVFQYISHLKNQSNYSVWAKIDPNMKNEYRGTDATVGFVAAWDSDHKQVGKGEQIITGIVDGRRIDTELRFQEPFEAQDSAYMTTETISDSETKVTWGFFGKMPYPMNILLLTMDMDKEVGSSLMGSLENLKNVLEEPKS